MKKLIFLSFLTSTVFGMELDRISYADNPNKLYIEPFSVRVPERLGELDLYHSKKGFYVRQDDTKHIIKKCFTDPILRDVTKTQLKSFLTAGYLTINQMDSGEYSVRAKMRLNGGGPILGTIAYWVTKSLCYGTAVAAVGTVTVATGGALGAAVGGAAAVGGTVVTGTAITTTAIGTTAGVITGGAVTATAVTTGAGVVGGAIAGAGLGGQAALVTAGAVTSAGGIAGTIAAVEGLSVAVGTFFGMLPTP